MIQSKYVYTGMGLTITSMIVIALFSQTNHTNKNIAANNIPNRILEKTQKAIDRISIDKLNYTVATLQSELGEIKSELALMHQSPGTLKPIQAVVGTTVTAQGGHTETPSSLPANPEYRQPAEGEEILTEANEEDRITSMDYAMYQLEPDSSWDGSAEEQLRRNIQDANLLNIQLQSVTCQGLVCRMEFSHSDEEALFEMLEGDTQVVSWNHKGRTATKVNAMNNNITVMYITREGKEFPQGF